MSPGQVLRSYFAIMCHCFSLLFIPHFHVDITNLRSGPILAVLIHSLLRSRAAMPGGMLLATLRSDNGEVHKNVAEK